MPVAPTWTYAHPAKGTCDPECPRYGWCHCRPDCVRRPRPAAASCPKRGHVLGRHYVFSSGHQLRHGNGGCYTKAGVPMAKIRPMVYWLHDHYGSWKPVAEILGISEGAVRKLAAHTPRQRVSPVTASKVVEAVLAHRRRSPLEPWATFDTDRPRSATQYERELSRRGAMASAKDFERRKQNLRRQWQREGRPIDQIREVVGAMQAPVSSLAYREW